MLFCWTFNSVKLRLTSLIAFSDVFSASAASARDSSLLATLRCSCSIRPRNSSRRFFSASADIFWAPADAANPNIHAASNATIPTIINRFADTKTSPVSPPFNNSLLHNLHHVIVASVATSASGFCTPACAATAAAALAISAGFPK